MRKIAAILLTLILLVVQAGWAEVTDPEDSAFLDKLEYDSILYFAGEAYTNTGLIKDSSRPGAPASVASVGFGLAALCIGESRGWIDRQQAIERIVKTLRFFRDKVPTAHGFYYHFMDPATGKRVWDSEVSSIDTALFIAGALFAGEYFNDTGIGAIARELYERVDWQWMMNGREIMCMGWKPESGFLWYYWDQYSEAMIMYALAIGSPTHPIPKEAWQAWKRPVDSYKDFELVYSYTGSLFTYQYSHAFIDFRRLYEGHINYYTNSLNATLANRAFCIDNAEKYRSYGDSGWGLTACIGPNGYRSYGALPGEAFHDGTIAPSGVAGSMVFDGDSALYALKEMYMNYGDFIYGKYGFKDAYNLDKNWWAEEWLGIDVGISLLMVENYRTGLVWDKFMKLEPVKKWQELCGITSEIIG